LLGVAVDAVLEDVSSLRRVTYVQAQQTESPPRNGAGLSRVTQEGGLRQAGGLAGCRVAVFIT